MKGSVGRGGANDRIGLMDEVQGTENKIPGAEKKIEARGLRQGAERL